MGKGSKIAWTTHTFNHIRGCAEVSPGCDNCYARVMALRNPAVLGKWGTEASGGVRILAADEMWRQPFNWDKYSRQRVSPDRVFCASLSDWAEQWQGPIFTHLGQRVYVYENEPADRMYWTTNTDLASLTDDANNRARWATQEDVVERLFRTIDETQYLDWLLLTKRPQRIRSSWFGGLRKLSGITVEQPNRKNVWLGTTIEENRFAEARLKHLIAAADLAHLLFLSVEPMLGRIDLQQAIANVDGKDRIGWVICGAEQGPCNRPLRPMSLHWARELRDQCKAEGVPFFMKQLQVGDKITDDIDLFPEDLQIREVPQSAKRD